MEKVLIFVFGAAVGGAAAYIYTKKKYQKIADEEIESMREYYGERNRKKEHADPPEEDRDILLFRKEKEPERVRTDYRTIAAEYMEANHPEDVERTWLENPYPAMVNSDHPTEDVIADDPYTITADQFVNEKRNYEKVTLLYFEGNGVLCDDTERMVEDIDASIGAENLDKFGEFEEDVAYIRNERLGIDYEVLLQHSTYKPPYPVEDDEVY